MATVTPSTVSLYYKKYASQPVGIQVSIVLSIGDVFMLKNIPSWLTIDSITDVSATEKTLVFNVDVNIANNLAVNTYVSNIEIYNAYYSNLKGSTGSDFISLYGPIPEGVYNSNYFFYDYDLLSSLIEKENETITVSLEIEDSVLLNVTPSSLLFTKNTGDTDPAGKIVQITSEESWTITKDVAWLTLSKTSGSNNDSFTINVDSTGLATASHLGTVTVTEGSSSKNIDVTFTISDGNTSEDYLYVNPTEIEIIRNVNSNFSPSTNIALSSSAAWTATPSETWITLSASSGSSGTDNIVVSADITGLSPGVFAGEIVFAHGTFIRKTYVTLRLYDLAVDVPESNTLYFAKDDVSLIMTSEKTTSYLKVDCSTETTNDHILYSKKPPFFLGKATANIGEEIDDILTPSDYPSTLSTSVLSLTTPAILNFTAYEVDYYTGQSYDSISRSNLFFLNGKTPEVTNKLCYTPSEIITTANAVIAFSIYKDTPPTTATITGSVNTIFTFDISEDTKVYTLFLSLKDISLKDKDVINVDFAGFTFTVKIKEPDVESVLLCFENEWKLPEIIECTGDLNRTGTANYTTQKLQVGKTIHERILEAEPGEEFTLISAWMYTQEDKAWLLKILDSKRMYLYINNTKIEVIPTFKKLELYNTNEHQVNYKLTFKKAIL